MMTWSSVFSSAVSVSATAVAVPAGFGTWMVGRGCTTFVGSAGESKRPRLIAAIMVRCCCSIRLPIHFSSMPLFTCSAYEVFFDARISPPTYTRLSMYGFCRPLSSVWMW